MSSSTYKYGKYISHDQETRWATVEEIRRSGTYVDLNSNGKKDEKGRHILQYVGTDVIRKKAPDYWVDFIAEFLEIFNNEWDWVLIPDTRFPNEVDLMREKFGATHVRIVRSNFESPLTTEQQNHPSEVALDEEIPDYYLMNTGDLDDLRETVNTWIKETIYAE